MTAWYCKLRALADAHGDYTQQDIAKRLGVSAAAVTYWAQGRPPAAQTVVMAAKVYHANAEELLALTFLDDLPPGRRYG